MTLRSIGWALALSFVLGIAASQAWRSCREDSDSRRPFRGAAVEQIPELVSATDKPLAALVVDNYREYRDNSVRWSAVYFGSIFGAAVLSALAALFLKLSFAEENGWVRKDLPAILATVSALLITLSTSGDFARKWQANRLAASDVENLAYDLLPERTDVDRSELIARLQAINTSRNLQVVGTDRSIAKPTPSPTEKETNPGASQSPPVKPTPSPTPPPTSSPAPAPRPSGR